MKLLRIIVLVIFVFSTISFTWYKNYETFILDKTGPEITYIGDSITVSIDATEEELLEDVTAIDQEDGDVTKSVIIEKISKLALGKRIITYAAFDSANNVTTKERELIYLDYTSPRFSLSKPLSFYVGAYDDILNYMEVSDCIDGDLTDKIKFEMPSMLYGEKEETFNVKFQVINSIGDTAVLPATVEFKYPMLDSLDKIPEIILKEYLIYLKLGESCNAREYLEKVKIGQKEYSFIEDQPGVANGLTISKNSIIVQSNMNLREPGIYDINYSMTTADGFKGTTKLLVIVEE